MTEVAAAVAPKPSALDHPSPNSLCSDSSADARISYLLRGVQWWWLGVPSLGISGSSITEERKP